MFERLTARAERLANARRGQALARLAEQAGGDLPPGVAVEASEVELVLTGRRLLRSFLNDARLRAIGLFAKGDSR